MRLIAVRARDLIEFALDADDVHKGPPRKAFKKNGAARFPVVGWGNGRTLGRQLRLCLLSGRDDDLHAAADANNSATSALLSAVPAADEDAGAGISALLSAVPATGSSSKAALRAVPATTSHGTPGRF